MTGPFMSMFFLAGFLSISGILACHKRTKRSFVLGVLVCFFYSLFWAAQPIVEGLDVAQYKKVFEATPTLLQYEYTGNHGLVFNLLMASVSTIQLDFRVFVFINYTVTSTAFLAGFMKVTCYPILALLFTLLSAPIFISMIRLHRQGLSVAFAFIAVVVLYKKRKFIFAGLAYLAVSLHPSSLVYLVVGFASKGKTLYKPLRLLAFFVLMAVCVGYIGANPNKILEIFKLIDYDGKYKERASIYLFDYDNYSLRFGVSRIIELVTLCIASGFLFSSRNVAEQDRSRGVDLHFAKFSLGMLATALVFYISFIWSPVFTRFVAYGAPYFSLLLILVVQSLEVRHQFLVRYLAFLCALAFYIVRVVLHDGNRIPVFL